MTEQELLEAFKRFATEGDGPMNCGQLKLDESGLGGYLGCAVFDRYITQLAWVAFRAGYWLGEP